MKNLFEHIILWTIWRTTQLRNKLKIEWSLDLLKGHNELLNEHLTKKLGYAGKMEKCFLDAYNAKLITMQQIKKLLANPHEHNNKELVQLLTNFLTTEQFLDFSYEEATEFMCNINLSTRISWVEAVYCEQIITVDRFRILLQLCEITDEEYGELEWGEACAAKHAYKRLLSRTIKGFSVDLDTLIKHLDQAVLIPEVDFINLMSIEILVDQNSFELTERADFFAQVVNRKLSDRYEKPFDYTGALYLDDLYRPLLKYLIVKDNDNFLLRQFNPELHILLTVNALVRLLSDENLPVERSKQNTVLYKELTKLSEKFISTPINDFIQEVSKGKLNLASDTALLTHEGVMVDHEGNYTYNTHELLGVTKIVADTDLAKMGLYLTLFPNTTPTFPNNLPTD